MVMAEKTKKRIINLIPNKGEGIFEQFLSWALTVGRLLIIITETLALSVFLYRFVLDVKIIDLHDKIKAESSIVNAFKDEEVQFRNLQTRLTFAKYYDSKKDKTLSLLQDTVELGRNKITFKSVTVTADGMDIEVQAPSASMLNVFVKALRNNPAISDVDIDRVENSPSSGIITVAIKTRLTENLQTSDAQADASDKGAAQ